MAAGNSLGADDDCSSLDDGELRRFDLPPSSAQFIVRLGVADGTAHGPNSPSEAICFSPQYKSLFGKWGTSKKYFTSTPVCFHFRWLISIERGVLAGYSCGRRISDSFGVSLCVANGPLERADAIVGPHCIPSEDSACL
jgi:hypothetical protein